MVVNGKQTPDVEGNWLYRDMENGSRYFTNIVYLGKDINGNDIPPYHECTNEEKEAYEREHSPEQEP